MIDCREAVSRMWAYLERELVPVSLAEFETHLDTCQRCCGELEFSRHLRAMVSEKGAPTIPDDVRARIDVLLSAVEQPVKGLA
jgi:mycothiol system anti-sigma-R factor